MSSSDLTGGSRYFLFPLDRNTHLSYNQGILLQMLGCMMSAKKVSLQNRKRLKDLMGDDVPCVTDEKRQALEAVQQDIMLLDEVVEESAQTGTAPECEQPVLDLVSPSQKMDHNASAQSNNINTNDHFAQVRALAEQMRELAERFERRNDGNRLELSRQAQHDALMDVLKKAIEDKAQSLIQNNMSIEKALIICQALADDVRVLLAQSGIFLNPLHLKQPRQARM